MAAHSPLAQFELHRIADIAIAGHDVSFTNSSLFMMVVIAAVTLFLTVGMSKAALVPGRWQSVAELSYEFIANMLRDNVGNEGRKYFPFVFTVFMFVLFSNVIGLIPYAFTVTSHIIVTFTLAAVIFLGVTAIGIAKHGFHFASKFVPSGVTPLLFPLLIPIELISYLVRPMSLSVRLFANMLAGHTMLKVFGGFVVAMGLLGVVPLVVVVGLTMLELFVAVVQAYVFTILTCIYLNDALHISH